MAFFKKCYNTNASVSIALNLSEGNTRAAGSQKKQARTQVLKRSTRPVYLADTVPGGRVTEPSPPGGLPGNLAAPLIPELWGFLSRGGSRMKAEQPEGNAEQRSEPLRHGRRRAPLQQSSINPTGGGGAGSLGSGSRVNRAWHDLTGARRQSLPELYSGEPLGGGVGKGQRSQSTGQITAEEKTRWTPPPQVGKSILLLTIQSMPLQVKRWDYIVLHNKVSKVIAQYTDGDRTHTFILEGV